MTDKQVLAALTTNEQKERAMAIIQTAQRFGKKTPFESMKTQKEVIDYVNNAVNVYFARKVKQKAQENKKKAEKAKLDEVIQAYKEALKNGASHQEILDAITGIYKNKFNARIQEQIDALKAKML